MATSGEVNIRKYDAVITRVDKPAAGSADEGKPDLIWYWGKTANTKDVGTFGPMQPLRRISVGARIVPGEEGDPCELKLVNGKKFLIVQEGILFLECGT